MLRHSLNEPKRLQLLLEMVETDVPLLKFDQQIVSQLRVLQLSGVGRGGAPGAGAPPR